MMTYPAQSWNGDFVVSVQIVAEMVFAADSRMVCQLQS